MEKVNLATVFKECRSMMAPLAGKRHLSLNIKTDVSGYVIADYTRLKQVLLNLLSNAIKYNVEHGSVSLEMIQKENNIVQICVIDTGKGISEELLKEVFQPFNRLNAACNIEGTGIGLSISKQLIEMMKGKIHVTSKLNAGSKFCIELPGELDITSATETDLMSTSSKTAIDTSTTQQHNILVAEDNPTNQALILNQLEALGYTADIAKDGQEALNKMTNHDYQLLLTDCNMPMIDGYELAKTIRASGNDKLPIIALTADAFPEKKAACLDAGMDGQITKPVNLETLKATLGKYLK